MAEDETVWVIRGTVDGTGQSRIPRAYHTDLDCPRLSPLDPEAIRDSTLERAEERDLSECKWCAGDVDTAQSNAMECGLCGAVVVDLADHLRDEH